MNQNILSLVCSYIFIVAVIAVAFILFRFAHLSKETTRKFIHIGVSNWVFILIYGIDSLPYALTGPVSFMIINAAFVYSGAAKLLGMGDRKRDNGLIYFPFSLIIMVLLYYNGMVASYDVIAGTLVMGYGDGLAALIGSKMGRHKYSVLNASKSWEGTAVMLAVSLIVLAVFTPYSFMKVLVIACVAAFFEAVTPLGLDNITVPILTTILGSLI